MRKAERESHYDLIDLLRVVIITYHVGDRKFERVFKENSRAEIMNMLRTKLQLPSNSTITLKQRRSGYPDTFIDLDDEGDFDAFSVHARIVKSVDVKVYISQPPATNGAASSTRVVNALQASEMSVTRNKRKAMNDQPPINGNETAAPGLTIKKRKTDQHATIVDARMHTDIARTPNAGWPFLFSPATSSSRSSAKREVSVAKLTDAERVSGAAVLHAMLAEVRMEREKNKRDFYNCD
ncbi:hypothetical protein F4604DRAFT_1959763 [Suillus subluteus]|nr:hypothetical protein F4604DRAFT_1959763 [Suillus subluteus]